MVAINRSDSDSVIAMNRSDSDNVTLDVLSGDDSKCITKQTSTYMNLTTVI